MSKEIAQTVGGKRIAWLLAILAAFAVMATVGSQFRGAQADISLSPTVTQSAASPAAVIGGTATFTGSVVNGSALTNPATVTVAVPAGMTFAVGNITCAGAGVASVSGQNAICTFAAAAVTNPLTTAVVATFTSAYVNSTGASVTVNDGITSGSAGPTAGYTLATVAGSANVVVAGSAATVTFSLPAGITYCSDATAAGASPRVFAAGDQVVSGLTVGTTTPSVANNNANGTHTVTVSDDVTVGGTVTLSTHVAGAGAGVGCSDTVVTLTATNFAVPELRHNDGSPIAARDISSNVRGSRHTVCLHPANNFIDTNGDHVVDVGGTGLQLPGLTLANLVFTNGGGYATTADTDPTVTDVRIFIGDGSSSNGNPNPSVTMGYIGATCISWVSLDAGDQTLSIVYVGDNGLNYTAHWDSDADGNGTGIANPSINAALVKEWNRLEDSTLTVGGVSATGSSSSPLITQNVNVTLNPATGLYEFPAIAVTDIFRGSHTNSAGQKEGPMSLAGVLWSYTVTGCGAVTGQTAGQTYVTYLSSSAWETSGVTGTPNLSFTAGATAATNCGPGRTARIAITGSEPSPLGSGLGTTVTEIVDFTFTTQVAAKQVFLAWAGQRIILEHDWRQPAGDVDGGAATSVAPVAGSVCPFNTQANNETFTVRYIRGSGPGNFLPSLGAVISGNDQADVVVDAEDNSQTDDGVVGAGATDIISGPNGSCISRVLYESEDQGQVDIEAFVNTGSFNVTKHAFVIYYMKINTVNVSLATQFSKPTHNSSAIPDWSNTGGTGAPTNPWDASKDDADNAAEWNVSKDLLVRGRVTGWFVNSNPSGRARDDSNPLNVLPADRWVMPNDWALLAGGPADAADGSAAIGTAEQFRPYYDILFGPNQTSTVMTGSPDGVAYQSATVVVASSSNTAAAFLVASCSQFSGVAAGTALLVGGSTGVTFTSCVFSAATGTSTLTVAGLLATPAAGTVIQLLAGVPFEGPYSLLDIPGLAVQGKGGAALSDLDPNNIRDTIRADGDVNMWDAPMPPAPVSVSIRGTGFIKQVLKQDVYYLGAPSATNSVAAQSFNNPFYIMDIPDSPFIPAIVVGGGYFWDTWGPDGPGGLGQRSYRFWTPAIIGTNSAGLGDSFTAAQTAELAYIRTAYGNDNTIARDLVVYTDNHGEFMVAANGDYRTNLTACATNVLAGGKHCATGDKVGTGTITATVDYPDFRGKHFPVLSNAATVDWTWGGYKDVTVEDGETDQFKYIVFHALDRDGFCSPLTTGAVLLHPVLSGAANDAWLTNPAETVDFLIDSGEGIIIGTNGATGSVNDGKQFATGVKTFSWAVNNPAVTGVKEFDFSPLAAEGQIDECQAWIKVSNSLLGVLNVLTIAHDDEGNIGFDRVIDLTNTHSYSLSFRWSLITWIGANAISVNDAITGTGDSGANPGGNDISASVTAIYGWDASAQQWLGFFPSGVNVPGANDLTSLTTGDAYWIAITGPSSVTWTIASNVN